MMDGRHVISTTEAAAAVGPYSQAVRYGDLLFVSGQLPIGLDGTMPEGIEAQMRQCLANLGAILKAVNSSYLHVVKTTVFLKSMDDFSVMNQIYAEAFHKDPPARSTIEISRLPRNALVEIECVAFIG
jgi:2-iminobutanoate/2-iminopropanoate deaminase